MTRSAQVEIEESVVNGVRVRVTRTEQGSSVYADCDCFGHPCRVHSNVRCPNLPGNRKVA
jgi:hypothetical protein